MVKQSTTHIYAVNHTDSAGSGPLAHVKVESGGSLYFTLFDKGSVLTLDQLVRVRELIDKVAADLGRPLCG